jgi:GT2 family glycosyltransferase
MRTAYFFGYGGSTKALDPLKSIIEESGYRLITIHEWSNSDIKWNRSTWLNELKKADIIIIPTNYKDQPCKSNNRLSQALSLGKPVICSPLDAYVRIHNENYGCCLIADTKEEWKQCLEKLKNEDFCKEISDKALIASKKYSIEEIGKKWISIFNNSDCLDIIIPSYNNVEYLKLCLESIERNTRNYKIIISDAGSDLTTWEFYKTLKDIKLLGEQDKRLSFSQACNAGILQSTSEYFVLLNSDTIVSKNWAVNLLKKMRADQNLAVCGVLSNCDRFWTHNIPGKPTYPMNLPDLDLVPGMKMCQLEDRLEDLYSFMDNSNKVHTGTLVEQEWVAFYATIFNRKIFNEIGFLDPQFVNGCEDLDFCIRIKKMGYKIAQAIDSFIFHFGGISRKYYKDECYHNILMK